MTPPTSFGYVDDFKVIASNSNKAEALAKCITKWSQQIEMGLNGGKSKVYCIKGDSEPQNKKKTKLDAVNIQKCLDVLMSKNLSWTENIKRSVYKALGAFFNLEEPSHIEIIAIPNYTPTFFM